MHSVKYLHLYFTGTDEASVANQKSPDTDIDLKPRIAYGTDVVKGEIPYIVSMLILCPLMTYNLV